MYDDVVLTLVVVVRAVVGLLYSPHGGFSGPPQSHRYIPQPSISMHPGALQCAICAGCCNCCYTLFIGLGDDNHAVE